MKRTTIFIDESLERDLQALAERQGRSRAAVVRLALERYVKREKQKAELELGFVGIGRSGRSDIAERHEEYLWQDLGEEEPRSADESIDQPAIIPDEPG
jgi:predicted transcriptional regulator